MSFCVNINSPEFMEFQKATGLPVPVLKSIIGAWMENNNTFEFPPMDYIINTANRFKEANKPSIKDIAIRYNMSETGFFSKYIIVENLKNDIKKAGLNYDVKQTSNGSGYYLTKNGKMFNPFKQEMKQQENAKNATAPIQELDAKITEFLLNIGVSIEEIPGGDFIAKANFINKVIEVVKGRADLTTLPEEASHFFIRMLKPNNPILYDKLVSIVLKNGVYESVYEEYKNVYVKEDGSPDIERIQEEAVAKFLAKNIVEVFVEQKTNKESKNNSILHNVLTYIKSLINKALDVIGLSGFSNLIYSHNKFVKDNLYKSLANDILSNKTKKYNLVFPEDTYEMLQKENMSTQSSIVDGINKFQNNIESVNENGEHFYKIRKGNSEIKVTGTPSSVLDKSRKYQDNLSIKEKELIEQAQKRGNKVHSWANDIIKSIVNNDTSETALYKSLSKEEAQQYLKLKNYLTAMINKIKEEDPGAVILSEVSVYDPNFVYKDDKGNNKKGLAGTIDMLVIHSDGTASIYDFKTISSGADLSSIGLNAFYKNSVQVALYKNILTKGNALYNIPPVRGIKRTRLVRINVSTEKSGTVTDLHVVGQLPVAGEKTGSEIIDRKIEELNLKFFDLINRKKPTDVAEREKYYERLKALKDAIIQLYIRRNVTITANLAIKDIQNIYDTLNSNKELTFDTLNEIEEIIDIYKDVFIFISNNSKELSEDDRLIINEVLSEASQLSDRIKNIKKQRIEQQAEELNITDFNKPQKALGFLERTFRSISQMNVPVIRIFHELVKKALYKVETDSNKLRESILNEVNALKVWAGSKGLSLQQAYDMIINKNTGTLISKYSKDFWNSLKKAKETGDIKWINANMYIDQKAVEDDINRFKKNIEKVLYHKDPILNEKIKTQKIKEYEEKQRNPLTTFHLKIKPEVEKQWHSQEWIELNKPGNEGLLRFYEFFTKTTKELSSWLPDFGYKENFIPNVEKNIIEKLGTPNKSYIEIAGDRAKSLLFNENDMLISDITDSQNGTKKQIPIFFVRQLDPKLKSYDLGFVLQLFGETSFYHREMAAIESNALALLDIAKNQPTIEVSKFTGKVKINPITGQPIESEKANRQITDLLEDMINYYVYNIKEEVPRAAGVINTMNKAASVMLLGLNIFPAIAATVANVVGLNVQASRNIFFTRKQLKKGFWALTGGSLTHNTEGLKAIGFITLFNSKLDQRIEKKNRKIKSTILTRNLSLDPLYFMLRKPDELMQDNILLAVLQNSMFDESGKIVLISTYLKSLRPKNYYSLSKEERKKIDKELEEKRKSIKSVYDLGTIKDGKFVIEGHEELSEDTIIAFRELVKQITKNIIGNYDQNDFIKYRNNAFIRALFLFRNFIPRLVDERYGNLRYNPNLEKFEWGRYRTFFHKLFGFMRDESNKLRFVLFMGIEDSAKMKYIELVSRDPELAQKISLDEFIDLYRENINATKSGLSITLGVIALLLMLKLGGGDDEDKYNNKFALRVVNRAYAELMMFVNPFELYNILKSPTATLTPVITLYQAITHSAKELIGETFDNDKLKEAAKPRKYWIQLVAPLRSLEALVRDFDDDWKAFIEKEEDDDEE